MVHKLRLFGEVEESIVDGPGLRYAVFTQGCPHDCKGCHNPEAHDVFGGYIVDINDVLLRFSENPLLAGITFSGGEPFVQPEPLAVLGLKIKQRGKTVVTYTGYTFETLISLAKKNQYIGHLLFITDILIDGPYVEGKRDLELLYRGSENQRVFNKKDIEVVYPEIATYSFI